MLKREEPTLIHLVLQSQPSEKLKLRISSWLWLKLQGEEGEAGHWQNEHKKEAIYPLSPLPSLTSLSPLALLQPYLKRLKP